MYDRGFQKLNNAIKNRSVYKVLHMTDVKINAFTFCITIKNTMLKIILSDKKILVIFINVLMTTNRV